MAFFKMDNDCSFRLAEMREISANVGLRGDDFRISGIRGSYSMNEWRNNGRTAPTSEKKPNLPTK